MRNSSKNQYLQWFLATPNELLLLRLFLLLLRLFHLNQFSFLYFCWCLLLIPLYRSLYCWIFTWQCTTIWRYHKSWNIDQPSVKELLQIFVKMVIFRYWLVSSNWTDGFVEGECSGQGGSLSYSPAAGSDEEEEIRFPNKYFGNGRCMKSIWTGEIPVNTKPDVF